MTVGFGPDVTESAAGVRMRGTYSFVAGAEDAAEDTAPLPALAPALEPERIPSAFAPAAEIAPAAVAVDDDGTPFLFFPRLVNKSSGELSLSSTAALGAFLYW